MNTYVITVLIASNLASISCFAPIKCGQKVVKRAISMNSPYNDELPSMKEEDLRAAMRLGREVTKRDTDQEMATAQLVDAANLDESFMKSLKAKRSYISIVVERLMQAVDDFQLSDKVKKSSEEALRTKSYLATTLSSVNQPKKERIVVLGTGWGGHAFLKTIDATKYDVTVISPRNYFMFTPMLAGSAVGTVEFRSICEPIRNVNPLVDYVEGTAASVDAVNKKVLCESVKCEGSACDITDFEVEYDYLLIAVGATTNTFGIKGVRENCQFLKQIEDATNLRKCIAYSFERANIPGLSEEEIRNALSFVVVGGGPTGVEFTSELRDWIEVEGRRYYPKLLKYVQITLVEAAKSVLAVFEEDLQKEALKWLTARETSLIGDGIIPKEMTKVLLGTGVAEVGDRVVYLSNGESLPYGFCVWAAGNGPIPFTTQLADSIPEQKALQSKARGRIVTDRWLRVLGMNDVFCIGDCAMIEDAPLPATAQVASQGGSYLGRLFSKGFNMKFQKTKAATSSNSTTAAAASAEVLVPPYRVEREVATPADTDTEGAKDVVHEEAFASDKLKVGSLSYNKKATIKAMFADGKVEELPVEYAKPFQFLNLGVLAYVGASQALAQISVDEKNILGSGPIGYLLWRSIYWSKQVSWRNRILVALDWIKGRAFGRDIGMM